MNTHVDVVGTNRCVTGTTEDEVVHHLQQDIYHLHQGCQTQRGEVNKKNPFRGRKLGHMEEAFIKI